MSGANPSFSTGRDCRVVMTGPFGVLDFEHVTDFQATQNVKKIAVDPMNEPRIEVHAPNGWEFTFTVERGNPVADQLAAAIEAAWWSGQPIAFGSLTQQITEPDSSVTTWNFATCAINLTDAGKWAGDSSVKQTVKGFARRRTAG